MMFTHLHVHTQFSLLDGASAIEPLMLKVKEFGMNSIAITDHGNMFGVPEFLNKAKKHGIKPIIGCEFYMAPKERFDKKTRSVSAPNRKDKFSYHQILLAKNETGYRNLCMLTSKSFAEGFYYRPRIDKKLIIEHREGLIATTSCLAAEIPCHILYASEEEAEKRFREWLDLFGDDFYIELQRHNIEEQEKVNEVLLRWSKKYGVKPIASNDVHYIEEKDWEAQDILLCLKTGKNYEDTDRMRFKGTQFYLKSPAQMTNLFKSNPEALECTLEVADKISEINLKRNVILPVFNIPEKFTSADDYLRYLAYEGARKRYNPITPEISSRLDYELNVIKKMQFAGYFLIVQDFIFAAKNLDVRVGTARGSAAGSVVAYCIGITDIDPLKYDLLFERFLNPERISMPDIDIDFDDRGRDKVIDYVINKYGRDHVAHLITFNMMGPKLAIRDVARVLKLPLPEADRLAKFVPDGIDVTFEKALREVPELKQEYQNSKNPLISRTLQLAKTLEGSPRHTGIHAAGIIIAPEKLENFIPLTTIEKAELLVTQYDGKYIEHVGMLKMDFLGLKTLTVINETIRNIKQARNIEVDIEKIPLDDQKTLELFQRGETIGIFQFESDGMRRYLKELRPTNLEDVIAMNALYRPGPMQFIPDYIERKHGRKPVTYPHPSLENLLKNTYGIMVYQEQVMQAVQILAGFSLGTADSLRRYISKKIGSEILKLKSQFIQGAGERGIKESEAENIYSTIEKFSNYGFNRSHAAGYTVLAFQTAYLKAHYAPEYMAAVLTSEMNDIEKVNYYIEESKRMKISVLNPDINESGYLFSVNKNNEIRFALAAIKNVGEGAVQMVVKEREASGNFKTIYDFVQRMNLQKINKRALESLAMAGAFDSFKDFHRAQYFYKDSDTSPSFIEQLVKYGSSYKERFESSRHSLFGGSHQFEISYPKPKPCNLWTMAEQLQKEKEITGIYISGHPLDNFKTEMEFFCNATFSELNNEIEKFKNKEVAVAGIVNDAQHRIAAKSGKPWGTFSMEDYTDTMSLKLFSDDYLKLKHYLEKGYFLWVKGKVQPRYDNPQIYELRVTQIKMLNEVKELFTKCVLLKVNLNDISENFIVKIAGIVAANPGKTDLRIEVSENGEMPLGFFTRKLKVNLNNKLLEDLKSTENMEIRLLS